ncbi:GPW/gp25 family protein [Kribbella sp. NPDC048915]|uniref:GPW/gp25 family protein n=1 Tax=Kribbella sp. NPDC048915 TaxID=3155148 RepID=UPI0033F2FD98
MPTTATDTPTGLGFPLDCGLGRFAVARGTDKLEQNMTQILLTYPGERVMRPDFGCRLRDFVFDSITPASGVWLADEVRRALTACEPRVAVEHVDVVPDEAVDGLVHLVIGYRNLADGDDREFVVDFRTDRALNPEGGD